MFDVAVISIGPAEPQNWSAHAGAFASQYAQARITRITDPDEVWAILAQRAMGSYAEIERASGVRFHFPVGHLRVNPYPDAETNLFNASEAIGACARTGAAPRRNAIDDLVAVRASGASTGVHHAANDLSRQARAYKNR